MFGVTFAAISFGFNQHRTRTAARMFDRAPHDFITRDDVIAVNDKTGNIISGGFVGKVFDRSLLVRRRRVRITVVFGDDDKRQLLHARKIQAFVKRPRTHPAVADIRDADRIFPLHTRG